MDQATTVRVITTRESKFIRLTRRFTLGAGALAVSYVALTLLHARWYQGVENMTLEKQILAQHQQQASPAGAVAAEGDVLGRIEIPRLGISVAILKGTTSPTLRLGVGHLDGTALPGAPGNSVIAGHRDTYFRALKDIRTNDEIRIQTATGLSRYQVDSLQIVAPNNIAVLAPSTGSEITLVTCYPFRFVGAAPERFVVHAHME
jgi:sortase A